MRFEPKTEAEVQEAGLLEPGTYDFEVVKAEDKVSNSGNDMAELLISIERHDGRSVTVKDFLVAVDSMAYKLRHFAESVGLLASYERGEMIASQMEGLSGTCKIGIEPAKGDYRAKNKVIDYLPQSGTATTGNGSKSKADLVDDEIPF